MTPQTAQSTATPRPSRPGPLLLVLSPAHAHVDEVRRIVAAWPRSGQVVWAADPAHALSLAMSRAPALAIVEAGLDAGAGRALAQQIARWQPETDVLTFAEQPGEARVMPWSEMRTVLDWWWQQCRPAAAALAEGDGP